jgi:phosphoglycolate phosphatase
MKSAHYRCLVFDWDGTLIDSIERIVTSLQTAALQTCKTHVTEVAARNVIGMGLMEALLALLPDASEAQLQLAADAYKHDYIHDNKVPSQLFTGVKEFLQELKSGGYLLAIATGKSRIGLDLSLAEHALEDFFATTRCAGEYRSKPHPEMLLSIVNDYDVAADTTLMIGDSEHDMRMANNAGIAAIGVTHGAHSAEVLERYDPLMCLQHITDLSDFLSHN